MNGKRQVEGGEGSRMECILAGIFFSEIIRNLIVWAGGNKQCILEVHRRCQLQSWLNQGFK
jgi:hypothetical protein